MRSHCILSYFFPHDIIAQSHILKLTKLCYVHCLYASLVLFVYAAPSAGTGNTGSTQAPAGDGQPGNQPSNPPSGGEMGTSYIQVTPEERQAIERVRD